MTNAKIDRRTLIVGGTALAAASLLPRAGWAAEPLIAAMFGGTWSEVHRNILKPCFEQDTGSKVSQSAMLATEQVSPNVA